MSLLRSAAFVLSGNATASLLGFLRNLVVARMISVEDFGIAATFAIALAVIEMASALGIEQQLIQAKDGERERLQAALQGFQFLRGVVNSIVLFLLAEPIARFLRLEGVIWAYQAMALVPLMRGLHHLDPSRLSRSMRFGPLISTQVLPALVALISVWPLVYWLGDYRVMVGVILLQSLTALASSHLVAERPYRLVFDRSIMMRSLRFGWPIMLNGVLLFGVFQGDRLIVGREIGIEALAVFSMAVTLTMTPMLLLTKSFQNLFLPLLSAARDTSERFERLTAVTLQSSLLAGLLLFAGIVVAGQPVIDLILGEKYAEMMPILSWMALVQAIRTANAGPAIVALSLGHSENAMYINIPRIAALPIIWLIAKESGELVPVVMAAIVAEIMGLAIALLVIRYKNRVSLSRVIPAILASSPAILVSSYWSVVDDDMIAQMAPTGIILAIVIFLAFGVWKMQELHRYLIPRVAGKFQGD